LLIWRVVRTALAVLVLASGLFLLSRADTDTALRLALPNAPDYGGRASASLAQEAAAQTALRQRLGLHLPLFYIGRGVGPASHAVRWQWHGTANQYHLWAGRLLHGDLGTSFRTGAAVAPRLRAALAITLPLTGTAAVLAVVLAFALAQRLAARPRWHAAVRAALAAVQAMPLFMVSLLLLLVFANPEVLAWFPAYGLAQLTATGAAAVGQYLARLVLPIAALTLTALPELTLQLEAALARELRTDYATTARAKGLAESAIIRHHALRNALLPTLTQLVELLPALVAGAVVVEVVFALPGTGRLLAEASAARDYPVLLGGVLLVGAVRSFALLLADLLYFWADPRIRWQP